MFKVLEIPGRMIQGEVLLRYMIPYGGQAFLKGRWIAEGPSYVEAQYKYVSIQSLPHLHVFNVKGLASHLDLSDDGVI